MDKFVSFVSYRNRPAAAMLAPIEETATQFRRSFVCCSLSSCRVRQVNSLLIPDELILGGQVEVVAGIMSASSSKTDAEVGFTLQPASSGTGYQRGN